MDLTIKINMDNAAFEDNQWMGIEFVINKMMSELPNEFKAGDTFPLFDSNGNRVGMAMFDA